MPVNTLSVTIVLQYSSKSECLTSLALFFSQDLFGSLESVVVLYKF